VSRTGKIASRLSDYTRIPLLREYLRGRNKRKAVFIWIPKTAGASLFSCFGSPKYWVSLDRIRYRFAGNGIVTFGHMDYTGLVRAGYVSRKFDKTAFKFAFVRNPYDRAVSLYYYLSKRGLLPADAGFLDFCRTLAEEGCEPIGLYNVSGLSQCNPQMRWLENIEMDFVGRFESIAEDSGRLFRELGLQDARLPMINKTTHASYKECYCRESKQIVEQFYAEDFLELGYEHDPSF
jgi:hypothetical protein